LKSCTTENRGWNIAMAATPAEQLQAKLNGPAMVPPPGTTPNFVNPANLNHVVVLTLILCMVFSTLAVAMRMYTKLFIIRKTAFEDCMSLRRATLSWSDTDVPQTSSF
jgi:hypothetical protein